jgi:hypothetical protein
MSADGFAQEAADFVCQARVPGGVCGATERHPANPKNQCVRGHFIVGSQQRLTHGAPAFERHGDAVVPADVRLSADDMLKGIIADKGGAQNLTTLKRELAQQARNFRVMLDLILHDLVRNGVTTKGGRVRSAVSKYLEILTASTRWRSALDWSAKRGTRCRWRRGSRRRRR